MGLQYPGGPEIEKLAAAGNPQAIDFPRALLKEDYQFSFSGLKSAVINYLHNEQQAGRELNKSRCGLHFRKRLDVLVQKSVHALQETGLKK